MYTEVTVHGRQMPLSRASIALARSANISSHKLGEGLTKILPQPSHRFQPVRVVDVARAIEHVRHGNNQAHDVVELALVHRWNRKHRKRNWASEQDGVLYVLHWHSTFPPGEDVMCRYRIVSRQDTRHGPIFFVKLLRVLDGRRSA